MTATLPAPALVDATAGRGDGEPDTEACTPRRVRASTSAVMAGGVGVVGLFIGLMRITDNSFLTHLATGRLILAHGIPTTDPYSFTAHGASWTVQSWLASAMYATAERVAGSAGVLLLQGCIAALLALVVWRLTRRASTLAGRQVAFIAVVIASAHLWSPRPLMLGYLFLGLTIVVVEEERSPWWLIPIGWLWVNVHGSFPLAIAYLAARAIGRRIDGQGVSRLLRYGRFAVVGMLSGGVSPVGPKLLVFPIELLTRNEVLSHVKEWATAPFGTPSYLLFLLCAAATLVVARRQQLEMVLPAALFVVFGIMALRNIPPAAVVLTPVLAGGLRLGRPSTGGSPSLNRGALLLFASVAALMVVHAAAGPAYDLSPYPVRELAWMDANAVSTAHLAAPDTVGNYLEWRDNGRTQVFMDDRFDMYPVPFIKATIGLATGAPGWDSTLDRYHVDTVLWPSAAPLAQLVSVDPRWHVVHRTNEWVVAVRTRA